ncbi:MAG: acyl-CoA dehydrogenase family protein, partial [Proteobacteria bacterium]|nr:acyl-CoA dehydrogenase family protein [Pseudomonadota bacterium]
MTYSAPVRDMKFALSAIAELDRLAELPGGETAAPDVVAQILEAAGKFAAGVLAPLNAVGDHEGAKLENGIVRTPTGFKDAYRQFVAGGWNGVPFDPDHGGQGVPWPVAMAVNEMWQSANLSFGLCPLLTQGAIDLLAVHGSAEQQRLYLGKLVSGEWTGTMNLTEPQAGSDVGALRCRAERDGDHYRNTGQKILITYGDHDITENIEH